MNPPVDFALPSIVPVLYAMPEIQFRIKQKSCLDLIPISLLYNYATELPILTRLYHFSEIGIFPIAYVQPVPQ